MCAVMNIYTTKRSLFSLSTFDVIINRRTPAVTFLVSGLYVICANDNCSGMIEIFRLFISRYLSSVVSIGNGLKFLIITDKVPAE